MKKASFSSSLKRSPPGDPGFWIVKLMPLFSRSRSCKPPGARLLLGFLLIACASGCNRQDTEAIPRMGRKIVAHARASADELSPKLDLRWKDGKHVPTLQEKIQERLRWESTLTEAAIEVHVKDNEVELKG